jgi:hypothetical protein
MALAMLFPEPGKRGRGNKEKYLEAKDFSAARLTRRENLLRQQILATAVWRTRGLSLITPARSPMTCSPTVSLSTKP